MQCFSQEKSSDGICYCDSFTESKFDAKYDNTVTQWNQQESTRFQKESNVWSKTFKNKSKTIAKNHWVQNKFAGYKILVLKHANRNITTQG